MSRVTVHVSPRGNAFMGDIADAIADAARSLGHDTPGVHHDLPSDDDGIHLVVAPHEFFRLSDEPVDRLRDALARSVLVATEQPGTPWFEYTVALCRGALAVCDINELSVRALRRRGVDATHLRLGAVPAMDATATAGADDPVDVVFLGALDDRRAEVLAALAPVLDRRRSELRLFPADQPVLAGAPGLRFGRDKYLLFARSRLLVNVHRAGHDEAKPYFEWARMVEAMANRCVVVTEPSSGYEPLRPGEHFVVARPEEMAATIESLLDDPARCAAIADAAHAVTLGELSLARSLAPVLAALDAVPRVGASRRVPRHAFGRAAPPAPRPVLRPHVELQRAAKRLVRRHDRMLRELDRVEVELRGGRADDTTVVRSPAWDGARADATVVVTLYNYGHLVGETLDSVLSSAGVSLEVVVVDDASTDDGRAVVLDRLEQHPHVPWTVVTKACNQGLSAARNTGFSLARTDAVMVVDADNLVHPHGIAKLLAALDAAPSAAGAYGILDDFGERVGLRSAFDWDVGRLCRANYIDAQALVRRSAWSSLGGYRDDDDEVYGWEDWDLWLRMAAAGRAMVFCPEIVGRYRTQAASMVSLSNVAADDMRAAIRRRYPQLPWPVEP